MTNSINTRISLQNGNPTDASSLRRTLSSVDRDIASIGQEILPSRSSRAPVIRSPLPLYRLDEPSPVAPADKPETQTSTSDLKINLTKKSIIDNIHEFYSPTTSEIHSLESLYSSGLEETSRKEENPSPNQPLPDRLKKDLGVIIEKNRAAVEIFLKQPPKEHPYLNLGACVYQHFQPSCSITPILTLQQAIDLELTELIQFIRDTSDLSCDISMSDIEQQLFKRIAFKSFIKFYTLLFIAKQNEFAQRISNMYKPKKTLVFNYDEYSEKIERIMKSEYNLHNIKKALSELEHETDWKIATIVSDNPMGALMCTQNESTKTRINLYYKAHANILQKQKKDDISNWIKNDPNAAAELFLSTIAKNTDQTSQSPTSYQEFIDFYDSYINKKKPTETPDMRLEKMRQALQADLEESPKPKPQIPSAKQRKQPPVNKEPPTQKQATTPTTTRPTPKTASKQQAKQPPVDTSRWKQVTAKPRQKPSTPPSHNPIFDKILAQLTQPPFPLHLDTRVDRWYSLENLGEIREFSDNKMDGGKKISVNRYAKMRDSMLLEQCQRHSPPGLLDLMQTAYFRELFTKKAENQFYLLVEMPELSRTKQILSVAISPSGTLYHAFVHSPEELENKDSGLYNPDIFDGLPQEPMAARAKATPAHKPQSSQSEIEIDGVIFNFSEGSITAIRPKTLLGETQIIYYPIPNSTQTTSRIGF
jgi:hypothetical protein